jgi:drug/metabolite transporter (DMT)-like permease
MATKRLFLFTFFALLAFAANSILCRLALKIETIDPLTFSLIRLISASSILWVLLLAKNAQRPRIFLQFGSVKGALSLLVYILCFSFAYVGINTATGALVLFAAVQFTMLIAAWLSGKHFSILEIVGVSTSLLGLLFFVYPELDKPNNLSFVIMLFSGIAWGVYSLLGSQSVSPLLDTSSNFIRLLPVSLLGLTWILIFAETPISYWGITYAIASGALASGLGYALWYLVLPELPKSVAAVCQLSVPIWAALGGTIFISEEITWHLLVSACIILGGILLVLLCQFRRSIIIVSSTN